MKTITTALVNKGGIKITKTAILLTCTCQPCGTVCTARLFMPYVGGGHGLTVLPREEDEVLIMFPDNNINMGIAFWGMYAGPDTVPDGTAENLILVEGRQGDDIQLHVRGNVNIHIDENQTTLIDGTNQTTIVGNNTTTLQANNTTTVTGNDHKTVNGVFTIIANGIIFNSLSTVSSNITGSYTLTANGLSFTSNAAASITAATTITLNAGGGTMTLTPGSATFNVPVSAPNIP